MVALALVSKPSSPSHTQFDRVLLSSSLVNVSHTKIVSVGILGFQRTMGKKRKHSETDAVVVPTKKDDSAPERPKRTLLGWKDKKDEVKDVDSSIFRNKEKVLVICSRRISYRYRHLMLNVVSLLPHCKKDNKVESKESKGATLNELVELKSCSSCLFFECRKQKDLYLWMAKCSSGPSVKFLVSAVHTMEELKLTGNHLQGSRPILTFSANFDNDAHWKLLKEIIIQIFGIPKEHRKSKPFHDHVFVFSIADGNIWFRNYQISVPHNESDKVPRGGLDKMTLIEVGPRFCLNPIKIFGGSFGGPTLYENPLYVSPNEIRALQKKKKGGKYVKKVKAKTRRKMHENSNPLEQDEFADMWKE
ncbi:ribosome biogenesis protein BRX1-like [Quillaja saponaria]|uniref:Ribosome biogenesis protein BRX1-like n=1 Tax=Quillaja saponaria TaxID=32244 RepID=A0AAD7VN82_QUISA|nr:ribosome biogenesis protein BRX1-like [Quillaja saponaria]